MRKKPASPSLGGQITFLIIVLAATAVFSACQKKPNNIASQPENNTAVENNQNEVATTTEKIDTSDWQTYRNEEYGFEVMVPQDCVPDFNHGKLRCNNKDRGNYQFQIDVNINRQNIKENDLVSFKKWHSDPNAKIEIKKINNYNIFQTNALSGTVTFVYYHFISDNYIYSLFICNYYLEQPVTNDFEEMAKTFKIFEAKENINEEYNDTGNWKTCTSNNFDIQFKYPEKWGECSVSNTGFSIKTDYQPYDVFLIIEVTKNNENNIATYKNKMGGVKYMKIESGEIFDGGGHGGGLAYNGAILDGDVYLFSWGIESDQKAPSNLDEIWAPNYNVTDEDIWNILKTITKIKQ